MLASTGRVEAAMDVPDNDPAVVTAVVAIRQGDLNAISSVLAEHPELAQARIRDGKGATRTLLHAVTDWPGYFPNGPEIVRLLIAAGADPNTAVTGSCHAETPLHWAASSDDVDVAAALIEGGADIEATGASIGGGPPLDDAVGYGCWHVARLLVTRGAQVDGLGRLQP
jgi:ankyrin repeat protein